MPKPTSFNRSKQRKVTFAEGSLERKLKAQEREQSAFDRETERMIAKFRRNNG